MKKLELGLALNLLGKPTLVREDIVLPGPKGRKAWALLSYRACADGNATRDQLAGLLFDTADDPVRALRWNLTEIRRSLRGAGKIEGGPPKGWTREPHPASDPSSDSRCIVL